MLQPLSTWHAVTGKSLQPVSGRDDNGHVREHSSSHSITPPYVSHAAASAAKESPLSSSTCHISSSLWRPCQGASLTMTSVRACSTLSNAAATDLRLSCNQLAPAHLMSALPSPYPGLTTCLPSLGINHHPQRMVRSLRTPRIKTHALTGLMVQVHSVQGNSSAPQYWSSPHQQGRLPAKNALLQSCSRLPCTVILSLPPNLVVFALLPLAPLSREGQREAEARRAISAASAPAWQNPCTLHRACRTPLIARSRPPLQRRRPRRDRQRGSRHCACALRPLLVLSLQHLMQQQPVCMPLEVLYIQPGLRGCFQQLTSVASRRSETRAGKAEKTHPAQRFKEAEEDGAVEAAAQRPRPHACKERRQAAAPLRTPVQGIKRGLAAV